MIKENQGVSLQEKLVHNITHPVNWQSMAFSNEISGVQGPFTAVLSYC